MSVIIDEEYLEAKFDKTAEEVNSAEKELQGIRQREKELVSFIEQGVGKMNSLKEQYAELTENEEEIEEKKEEGE